MGSQDADRDISGLITRSLSVRTTHELVKVISELAQNGDLRPGDKLPTVRDFAHHVGMSRSAVAKAWTDLNAMGVLLSRRRGGTSVLGGRAAPRARRFEAMVRATVGMPLDLANVQGDDIPRPPLGPAFAASVDDPSVGAAFAEPICQGLADAVRGRWPDLPPSLLATHGGPDGIELFLTTMVGPGDRVIVESPTIPRVLDIIDSRRATPLPVRRDAGGLDLDELRRAIAARPAAMVYQPVGALPTGTSVTASWIDSAAHLLAPHTFPILEYNGTPLFFAEVTSLAEHLPTRVAHVMSFNFFFGRDLRVGTIAAAPALLEPQWLHLTYSSRYVSRYLQLALAFLLTDPASVAMTEDFLTECHRRRSAMADALRAQGFACPEAPGPSMWLEVPDEVSVAMHLGRSGIAVHPGTHLRCPDPRGDLRPDDQRIHVCSANMGQGQEEFARLLAVACAPATSHIARGGG